MESEKIGKPMAINYRADPTSLTMSHEMTALVLISLAAVTFVCAVALEKRISKTLFSSILTIGLKSLTVVIMAAVLKLVFVLSGIAFDVGIGEAMEVLKLLPTVTTGFTYRLELARLLPVGAFVAFVDSTARSRFKKIVRNCIAAIISTTVIQMLILPEHLQTSNLILLSACVVGGCLIGTVVGSIGSFPKTLYTPQFVAPLFAFLRGHPKSVASALFFGLVIVDQTIPRNTRVFMKLSVWKEITIEYVDLEPLRNSQLTSLLLGLFNSWPVGGGDDTEWLTFKSRKNELAFVFREDDDKASGNRQIELIVSRVDDSDLKDEFLYYRFFRQVALKTEAVYRGNVKPGTFTIEAPEFSCGVYTLGQRNETKRDFVVSAPLRTSFSVSKERSHALIPGLKEISSNKDWISVRSYDDALGFVLNASNELTMFCRASRSSANVGARNIRIHGSGLPNPIDVGGTGGNSERQAKTPGTQTGFLVQIKRPGGRVGIGIVGAGANTIAVGTTDFRFLQGSVGKITVREPTGTIKIDADEIRELDTMDELSAGGELELSAVAGKELTLQGQSRKITLNGRSLAKPLFADWLVKAISNVLSRAK